MAAQEQQDQGVVGVRPAWVDRVVGVRPARVGHVGGGELARPARARSPRTWSMNRREATPPE
jgi:hypothetical protein